MTVFDNSSYLKNTLPIGTRKRFFEYFYYSFLHTFSSENVEKNHHIRKTKKRIESVIMAI